MGVMLCRRSLRWFRIDWVWKKKPASFRKDSYDILTAERKSLPGAEGLIFLPYLTGERTPHADPYARGCSLTYSETPQNEMVRAVMEGVTLVCVTLLKS